MDSSTLIKYMIIICIIFILLLVMSKPLKILFKIGVQGFIGAVGFLIMNSVLAGLNIAVGVNILTVISVGILGLPGFISMYVINAILR